MQDDIGYNSYIESVADSFFENYFGPSAQTMRSLFDSISNSTRENGTLMTSYISGKWTHAKQGPNIVYRDAFVYTENNESYFNNPEMFDGWINLIEQALADIEYLKTTDNNLYQIYYDRIALERISVYYMAIECYPNRYQNVADMKAIVKADALRFGITMYDMATGTDGVLGYIKDLYT